MLGGTVRAFCELVRGRKPFHELNGQESEALVTIGTLQPEEDPMFFSSRLIAMTSLVSACVVAQDLLWRRSQSMLGMLGVI